MNPYAPLDRLSPGASQRVVLGVFGALAAEQALGYRARQPWHERDRLVEDQPGPLGDG